MASRLEAVFALIDKASGPASTITSALVRLGSVFGGGVGAAIASFGAKLDGAGKQAEGLLKEIKLLGDAGSHILELGKAIAEPIYELGKFALEASEAKKRGIASLEAIDGAGSDAAATLDRLKGAANEAGKSDEDLLRMYNSLRLMGNSADVAEAQIAAMLDVTAIRGDEGAQALQKLFDKIEAGGKFEISTKQLAAIGLKQDAINNALRSIDRFKNASDAQLKAAMDSGRITAEEGASAVLRAVNDTFDKGAGLGTVAKKIGGESFSGRVQALKNVLGDLFEDFDAKPLIDALRSIQDVLASPAGKKAVAALNDMLAGLAKQVAAFATPENITSLVTTLGDLAAILLDIGKAVVGGLGSGFMEIMQPAIDVFRDLGLSGQGAGGIADVFRTVGRVVGWVAAFIVYGVGAIAVAIYGIVKVVGAVVGWISDHLTAIGVVAGALLAPLLLPFVLLGAVLALIAAPLIAVGLAVYGVWEWITGKGGEFVDMITGWAKTFTDIGKSLIQGLIDGITGGSKDLSTEVGAAMAVAEKAARDKLDTHSPSRLFMSIGSDVMAGMTLGIRHEAANTNDVMADVADEVAGSARVDTAPAGGGGRAGGRGPITINAPITIQGAQGEGFERVSQRAIERLREQLVDVIEELDIEYGAIEATG
jgi:hypothetical protein